MIAFMAAMVFQVCPPLDASGVLPPCYVRRESYPNFAQCEAALTAGKADGSFEAAAKAMQKYADHRIIIRCEGDGIFSFTVPGN